MMQNTTTDATGEPLPDCADERDAIRDELRAEFRGGISTDMHILTFYASEPMVALVRRERAPSTGYPSWGETVVVLDWHGGDNYAVSVAEGERVGTWTMIDETTSTHNSRADAIQAASKIFDEVEA